MNILVAPLIQKDDICVGKNCNGLAGCEEVCYIRFCEPVVCIDPYCDHASCVPICDTRCDEHSCNVCGTLGCTPDMYCGRRMC